MGNTRGLVKTMTIDEILFVMLLKYSSDGDVSMVVFDRHTRYAMAL